LAERVEKAAGPDREIDRDIAVSLGWRVLYDAADPTDRVPYYQPDPERSWVAVPLYTFSIDAAMLLVPEGCAPGVYQRDKAEWASMVFGPDWQVVGDTRAATAAVALTAAALRARAASTPSLNAEIAGMGDPSSLVSSGER
jgi:hypothetical protein